MKLGHRWIVRGLLSTVMPAALALGVCGCPAIQVVQALGNTVQGSGKKAAENRSVSAFHGADFAGSGKVEYRIGSPQSVRVETDDNLLSHVETIVRDGRLHIGFKGNVSTRVGLHVTVVAPSCDAAVLSGSGDVIVSGLKERKLRAEISGSGNVSASGSATTTEAVVTGSGSLDLSKLKTGDANAEVTGSGEVHVAPTGTLDAEITGSGTVHYTGSPKSVRKRITGSGSIVQG